MAVAVAVTDDVVVYLVVTKALKVVVVVEAVAVVVYLVVSVYTFCLDNTYTHFWIFCDIKIIFWFIVQRRE